MEAKSVRNMYSIIVVTNKHTAKLYHVGSLYILTYDARKLKHKMYIGLHVKCTPFFSDFSETWITSRDFSRNNQM